MRTVSRIVAVCVSMQQLVVVVAPAWADTAPNALTSRSADANFLRAELSFWDTFRTLIGQQSPALAHRQIPTKRYRRMSSASVC